MNSVPWVRTHKSSRALVEGKRAAVWADLYTVLNIIYAYIAS